MDEDEQFNQAFGEHTDISSYIEKIKNNDVDTEKLGITESITDLAWRLLGRYIANNTHIKSIDLTGCGLTDEKMALLFSELSSSTSVKEFDVHNNRFGIDGFRCMASFLEGSPKLSQITFSDNDFGSECFELLIQSLHGKAVEVLYLRDSNITDISALSTYTLPNLTHVQLENNNIGRKGCMILADVLRKEGSTLTYLDLDNTGIDDEGVEILAKSLKLNTKLDKLLLDSNDITEKGRVALLKTLNDMSSIENTYYSNHTLKDVELYCPDDLDDEEDSINGDNDTRDEISTSINEALKINRNNQDPHAAGRAKVIKYQLNSQNRKEACYLQGTEYSAETNILADIEPILLPQILALVGEKHGQSELYTALLPTAPELMSFIDRKAMIEDEKGRNAVHTTALKAEYERKMAALNAEYEQKLAVLTAKDNDLSSRLALFELGDRKHQQSVVDGGKEGGEKRQRIN